MCAPQTIKPWGIRNLVLLPKQLTFGYGELNCCPWGGRRRGRKVYLVKTRLKFTWPVRFSYSCNFMCYTRTFFPTIFDFEIFIIKQFIWDPEIGSQPPSLLFCSVFMQVPQITDTLWGLSYQYFYSRNFLFKVYFWIWTCEKPWLFICSLAARVFIEKVSN